MAKFLTITHGFHNIIDSKIHETHDDAKKYIADYIFNNLNPDEKKYATQSNDPYMVSLSVEGAETPDVFTWFTDQISDTFDAKNELHKDWSCDHTFSDKVSFIVEIPENAKYFVFPIGYNTDSTPKTITKTDYSNYAFFNDFVSAQTNTDLMYASAVRNMKKNYANELAANEMTSHSSTETHEFVLTNSNDLNEYMYMQIVDLATVPGAVVKKIKKATAKKKTKKPTNTTAPATNSTTAAPTTNSEPTNVEPLTGDEKINTDYLKQWIEYTIAHSKVLSGNYTLSIKREYKNSTMKKFNANAQVGFKGLVDAKKYPKNVCYRGFTVQIDVGGGNIYEGKIHIASSDKLITAVGLELSTNPTSNQVFDNIFTKAQTNDPKFGGKPAGSLEETFVHTTLVLETNDKRYKRIAQVDLMPSEIDELKNVIGTEEPEYPERIVWAVNTKFTRNWQSDAKIIGLLMVYEDAKIETFGQVDIVSDKTTDTTDTTANTTMANANVNANAMITLPNNPTLTDIAMLLDSTKDKMTDNGMTVTDFAGTVKPASKDIIDSLNDGLISELLEYASYIQGNYNDESSAEFNALFSNPPECITVKVKSFSTEFWDMNIFVEKTTRVVVGYTFMDGTKSTTLKPITPISSLLPVNGSPATQNSSSTNTNVNY